MFSIDVPIGCLGEPVPSLCPHLPGMTGAGLSVLVEDDELVLEALQEILESWGVTGAGREFHGPPFSAAYRLRRVVPISYWPTTS